MPFEVFGPFVSCSESHGAHQNLREAANCLNQIADQRNGKMPVHPITGKFIHAIAAVDRNGNQLPFQEQDLKLADELGLDSKAVMAHKLAVTTINNLAGLYCEALASLPMLTVNLEGLFEDEDRDSHRWSTDAGRGQCLAYILQAAFTLELTL